MVAKPYSNNAPGGIVSYINKLEAIFADLEIISPGDYRDSKKKRMLLMNIQPAIGVTHLIQTCRDSDSYDYKESAAYLRRNAVTIDYANQARTPTRLMHVEKNPTPTKNHEKTVEEVSQLFTEYAEHAGINATYKHFNVRGFRDNLSIPPLIWNELEPSI
jgi:hypothetical protein